MISSGGIGNGGGMIAGGGGPILMQQPRQNRNPLSVQSVIYPGQRNSWEYPDMPPPLPPRSYSQSFSQADHPAYSNHPPSYSIHDPLEDPSGAGNLNNTNNTSHKSYRTATNNDVSI